MKYFLIVLNQKIKIYRKFKSLKKKKKNNHKKKTGLVLFLGALNDGLKNKRISDRRSSYAFRPP